MSYQIIRNQFKHQVQKIRLVNLDFNYKPSSYCQACLGEKVQPNDYMLICSVCQSSIHKSHYASELVGKTINQNHLIPNLQDWKCQRCRYYIEKKFQQEIKCEFCPNIRGIMKKVIFQYPLQTRNQIWVHPQCTTWCHPIIWMKNKKRAHYYKQTPQNPTSKFWFKIDNQPTSNCNLCSSSYGYKIKCSFYSCQKFYHITCAKKLGIIRDLQSMRFDPNDQYSAYCPVYCQEHLENYILDFANRIKLYTQQKQSDKVVHFTKLHNCYKIQLPFQVQLKNLHNSVKRVRQQEQMRNQLGKQFLFNNFEQSSMSLSISQLKSNQIGSESSSQSHSSGLLTFLDNHYNLEDIQKITSSLDKKKRTKKQKNKLKKHQEQKNKNFIQSSQILQEKNQQEENKVNEQINYNMDLQQYNEQEQEQKRNQLKSNQQLSKIKKSNIKFQQKQSESLIQSNSFSRTQNQMIDQQQEYDKNQNFIIKENIDQQKQVRDKNKFINQLQDVQQQNQEYQNISFSFTGGHIKNSDIQKDSIKNRQLKENEQKNVQNQQMQEEQYKYKRSQGQQIQLQKFSENQLKY